MPYQPRLLQLQKRSPYVIGKRGEARAKELLEQLGYTEIKKQTHTKFYDFSAKKNDVIYHIEVKTRTGDVFHILAYTVKRLLEIGNGLIMLMHGDDYQIIPAELLEYRLKKDSIILGLSFHKNYANISVCNRCGHKFITNSVNCPKCKSPYWNKEYKGINHE